MNKAPLTPVAITDKNGVLTTRHKKVVSEALASGKSIPAPSRISRPKVSDEQAVEFLKKLKLLNRSSSVYQNLHRVITTELRVSEFEKAEVLLDIAPHDPDERDSGRRWLVQKILEQEGDKEWRLEVSTGLAQNSRLNSRWYLAFIKTLVDEEGYGRLVRGYSRRSTEDQHKVCGIADALAVIEKEYHDNPPPEAYALDGGFMRNSAMGGGLYIKDPYLFKALVEHPEKASQIAKMYVERWSLDTLDDILEAPSSLADGAL